ncbi:hypothetical protein D3C71_1284600 [compost metagenome]
MRVNTFWPLTAPLMLLPLMLMTTGWPPLVSPCRPGWLASKLMLARGSLPAVMLRSPERVWAALQLLSSVRVRETGSTWGKTPSVIWMLRVPRLLWSPSKSVPCTCSPRLTLLVPTG